MARPSRKLLVAAAALSAVGLAGVGLLNPEPGAPTPSQTRSKPTPRQPAASKPRATLPQKPHPKASHAGEPKQEPKQAPKHEPEPPEHAEEPAVEPAPSPELAPAAPAPATPPDENTDEVSSDAALRLLQDGNMRWAAARPEAPHTDSARRESAANGQKPFATILTCADSRLPVERIFDRGVGDLFVVRIAGNVVSGEIAGTIEYAADHLKVPLLVIMGHTRCGAVAAASAGGAPEGNVGLLIEKIAPAVARARQQAAGADPAELAGASVKENVWQGMFDLLRTSGEVRHLVKDGKMKVVGAVCDVASGKVEWIGQHPWQDALVDAFDAKAGSAVRRPVTADAEPH
jgi:carbonic anhydrase